MSVARPTRMPTSSEIIRSHTSIVPIVLTLMPVTVLTIPTTPRTAIPRMPVLSSIRLSFFGEWFRFSGRGLGNFWRIWRKVFLHLLLQVGQLADGALHAQKHSVIVGDRLIEFLPLS